MQNYLKVVVIALSVFLLSACGSNSSSGGNNSFVADGGSSNGGNEGGNNSGDGGEIIKSVSVSLIKSEDGTYSFKPEFKNVTDSNIKYNWDFGGRVNQPAQKSVVNPVVTYVDEGDYTVQLTADVKGNILKSNTINISYYQPVKAKSNYGKKYTYGILNYKYLAGVVTNKKLYHWGKYSTTYAALYENNESIKDIALTHNSYIALTESGKVYTYGGNSYGTLGDGTSTARKEFKIVETLNGVKIEKIFAGEHSVYAIDSEGKVWSWGNNDKGQLGLGDREERNVPVQIAGLNNVVNLAVGYASVYALTKDGEVYSWGSNTNGQLGIDNTTTMTSPVKIEAFAGKVITAIYVDGYNLNDKSVWHTAYAIDKDGKLYGWGANGYGNLSNTPNNKVPNIIEGLKDKFVVSVAQNSDGSVWVLDENGNVYSWGRDSFGELGHGTIQNLSEPKLIEYFTNNGIVIRKVFAGLGTKSIFAIDTEGKLYAWGSNGFGQLGINGGNIEVQTSPILVEVLSGNKIINVESNNQVVFAVSNTGKVFITGINLNDEFGIPDISKYGQDEFIEMTNIPAMQ